MHHEHPEPLDMVGTLEKLLDAKAERLVDQVNRAAAPHRAKNKKRWEAFAKMCQRPIVGNLYFRKHTSPNFLVEEPPYEILVPGYRETVKAIKQEAWRLEKMKAADMNRYGDEIVAMIDPSDPHDSPGYGTRRECYAMHYTPATPEKYDFHSLAGEAKMQKGAYVMDSRTKQVVPLNQCEWSWQDGKGTTYRQRPEGYR